MKTCSKCGQTIPGDIPFMKVGLSPGQFLLAAKVFAAGKNGVSKDVLFDFLYSSDPNGGPTTGHKVMHVQKWKCNRKLEKIGAKIKYDYGIYKWMEI